MTARSIRVRGVVQGVGFRPFVFRLARANELAGWVLNEPDGVDIHLEGAEAALEAFLRDLELQAPAAAQIASVDVRPAAHAGFTEFTIRESGREGRRSARISPDLPVCDECLRELFDPADRRYRYPYINCTNCGPRYSVIERLPYDRPNTTMKDWPLDAFCAAQYSDPEDRRFHAQPVACPSCGPHYALATPRYRRRWGSIPPDRLKACPTLKTPPRYRGRGSTRPGRLKASDLEDTARLLAAGQIVAIKGIGGYHLACDARNAAAVQSLRERKFRKERPFAVMVRDLQVACAIVELSPEATAC